MTSRYPAYSVETGKTYPTWDDLVAAEGNGYVVIVTHNQFPAPAVYGPFPTKREATNAKLRAKTKLKREYNLDHMKFYIRVAWDA